MTPYRLEPEYQRHAFTLHSDSIMSATTWQVHHDDFQSILGPSPSIDLLLQDEKHPLFHEAGVFLPDTNELFITSNQFKDGHGETKVQISKISLGSDGAAKLEPINCDLIAFANGGVNYKGGILFCAQGSGTRPCGLFHMQSSPPYRTEPVVTSYLGKPFNSVNDVVVHEDGGIWFTDPSYGHDQGYRPRPSLPNMVHRYDPASKSSRVMADGFGRPNGLCFSPDRTTLSVPATEPDENKSA